jgi:cytoskeletal protein RodZ
MEDGAKRIVVIIAVAAVAAVGVFWYWQRAKQHALGSGNVYVKNQVPNQSADQTPSAVLPATTSTTTSSQPEDTVSSGPASTSAFPPPASKPSAAIEKTVHAAQSAPSEQSPAMTQPRGALEVPVSDTIQRNPPTGLIFAGAGKYQLYRQGDITWRLDTDTGRACIIFATDTQWSRNRVYDQGCGAS